MTTTCDAARSKGIPPAGGAQHAPTVDRGTLVRLDANQSHRVGPAAAGDIGQHHLACLEGFIDSPSQACVENR